MMPATIASPAPTVLLTFDVWRARNDKSRLGDKAGAIFTHRNGDEFDPSQR